MSIPNIEIISIADLIREMEGKFPEDVKPTELFLAAAKAILTFPTVPHAEPQEAARVDGCLNGIKAIADKLNTPADLLAAAIIASILDQYNTVKMAGVMREEMHGPCVPGDPRKEN